MDDKVVLSAEHCQAPDSPERAAMETKRHQYMQIAGGVLWLSNVTRFDLAYAASLNWHALSRTPASYTTRLLCASYTARLVLYIKNTATMTLTFAPCAWSEPWLHWLCHKCTADN